MPSESRASVPRLCQAASGHAKRSEVHITNSKAWNRLGNILNDFGQYVLTYDCAEELLQPIRLRRCGRSVGLVDLDEVLRNAMGKDDISRTQKCTTPDYCSTGKHC